MLVGAFARTFFRFGANAFQSSANTPPTAVRANGPTHPRRHRLHPGLVCLGYPFHPAGKPERLRVEYLKTIETPTLIVQGERDALGNKDDVSGYELSTKIQFQGLPDGDHSFKPRKRSGESLSDNLAKAVERLTKFLDAL